ncbi:NAD(P)/FAD-dependent oxidoreductase [Alteraurantiacibacter aestuarii]|uniref:FAD-dependent monooxygenase n=1 Tax=Alteraurantiacibacter aestuarii TaxID=650004 RepID=A0A844ZHJ4_9SPHN|nr:NAD(P)/FAD-dependent oxidoreductase [Alteraurantiacibacter aestuarii]MXO87961.1 FAD-dependent monooxygenase [Alteraurantiacibacter aestuarii]
MNRLDIAIAGCGIAGLASALLLHRQGHRVTLYDRFARPRPVGSGLMIQPTGLAVLARLGLAQTAVARGAPIQRLHGLNREGEAVLEADYADLSVPGVFGLGIHRASLFDLLHSAVLAEKIPVLTDHEICTSEEGTGQRIIRFANRDAPASHDLLVDCLGVGSPLTPSQGQYLPFGALWTTLEWPEDGAFDLTLLEQRYEAAHRMVGILPTGVRHSGGRREFSFFWSLQQQDHAAWQANGLQCWKDEVRGLWPQCETILPQIASADQMTFARYAHRTFATPVEARLIHIGDAWHSASPQLGQGANMALLDAWALALGLAGEGDLQARLHGAIALRQAHVRLYQRLTAAFTPLYQSHKGAPAALRDLLLAPASRIAPGPAIKAMLVAGMAGSPLGRLGLAFPDYEALRPKGQSAPGQ